MSDDGDQHSGPWKLRWRRPHFSRISSFRVSVEACTCPELRCGRPHFFEEEICSSDGTSAVLQGCCWSAEAGRVIRRANFRWPFLVRRGALGRAELELRSVNQRGKGRSEGQLGIGIRLHDRVRPSCGMALEESLGVDTFIHCLPEEERQLQLRDVGAVSLSEYWIGAQELQNGIHAVLSFSARQIEFPQGGVDLFSCNHLCSWVRELRLGSAGSWPKGGTDVPQVGLDGSSGRGCWVSLSGPETLTTFDILLELTDPVGKGGATFVTVRDPGGDPIWEILGCEHTPQGLWFVKPPPPTTTPSHGPSGVRSRERGSGRERERE
ncbi:MAG: hypothetical protein GY696_22180, partial [Gammaproteobacteria bacterium]|nr:hypothetical protein [Gammaproteobacteria bacterium]